MRIIGVIIEAVDPIGVQIITGDHTDGLSKGKGDNKITIEANFKATAGNLILLMVAIIIITMVIIKAEVTVAMVVTFTPHGHRRGNYRGHNNYPYHQYYMHDVGTQFEQYGPPCTLCGGFNHSPKHCFN